jgi:hypothetical protein
MTQNDHKDQSIDIKRRLGELISPNSEFNCAEMQFVAR